MKTKALLLMVLVSNLLLFLTDQFITTHEVDTVEPEEIIMENCKQSEVMHSNYTDLNYGKYNL